MIANCILVNKFKMTMLTELKCIGEGQAVTKGRTPDKHFGL